MSAVARNLLLPLGLACLLSTALAAGPGERAIEIPAWFASSFLDFREDVKDAAAQGKRVMLYVGQDGCPYCKRLMEANFSQRDIVALTRRRFVAIALDLWGDRETTWMDGKPRSEKELGAWLRVQFTPTLLFLDERGAVVLRLNGYQPPARLRAALDYASGAQAGGEDFARYLQRVGMKEVGGAAPEPGLFREPPVRISRRGSPTWVLFESRDCEPCAELHAAMKAEAMRAYARRLDAVRVDAFGTRSVTSAVGSAMTEAELARSLGITFTPALVFLGDDGREVFRAEGYLRAFHLESVLDYVASGAYRTEPSFQRFIQARAERERSAGRPVELW